MAKDNWDDYDASASPGPLAWFFKVLWPTVLVIVVLTVVVGGLGYAFGWFGEAATVAQKELGPTATLKKYEWFKDASASLQKKQADIQVYTGRMTAMNETYKNLPRQNWPREDREQYNVWSSEVAGAKAGYNTLAAEYNANMTKVNWRYADTLPREFTPYVTQ